VGKKGGGGGGEKKKKKRKRLVRSLAGKNEKIKGVSLVKKEDHRKGALVIQGLLGIGRGKRGSGRGGGGGQCFRGKIAVRRDKKISPEIPQHKHQERGDNLSRDSQEVSEENVC